MENLGPLFIPPGDATEAIPAVLPLLLALGAIAACVWLLVRGKAGESMMVASIATVPILAFALSDAVLIERSMRTEFCVTCHLMEPLLETARPEDPASLASIHISRGAVSDSQACFTCHSGYGLHGEFDAKLAGVRHMILTVLDTHSQPLAIHGTFDIDSCRNCHAASVRFRSVEAHQVQEIQDALLAGEMSCTGMCHPAAHSDVAIGAAP